MMYLMISRSRENGYYTKCNDISYIPETVMVAESLDGLLLATVQVYSPAVVTVRVWV